MTQGIDVLTLLYDAKRFVDRYFDAFSKVDYPKSDLRIHLLDNSPDKDTYDYVNEKYVNNFPFQVKLYRSEENLGFSGGNNFLFKKLIDNNFPYYFLLNQDGAVHPDCFRNLVEAISNMPQTGMLEAKQTPKEHPKYYDPETFVTSWCSGGGVLIRKQALKEVGYFDHNFFLYCEDVDLSWRMWLANWKCKICPEASYEHLTEELDEEKDQSIRYFYSFRNGFFVNLKYNSLAGILKYYVIAFLVCFKQDPARKKAFLKAYFAAQKLAPVYLLKRILKPVKKHSMIIFDMFEFGKRRKFEDTADGKRVFLTS